jgi:Flp pilus assembly protein TadG
MVEVAFILPIVVLFIFGLIQFSTSTFNLNSAAYGSTQGARYASVHGANSASPCSAANVTAVVIASMPGVPAGSVTVTTTWNPNNTPGNTVTVAVSIKPWIKVIPTGSPAVGAKTQMTILQ